MKTNRTQQKLHTRRGFTYLELMIVVAILAALCAIGIFSVAAVKRNMEQSRLDRIAENLYSAAQNQLTLRAAQGTSDEKLKDTELVAEKPADLTEGESCFAPGASHALHYISHILITDQAAELSEAADDLFPMGTISEDVRSGNWIVEFEPDSHTVYSVFYSESKDPRSFGLNALRGTPDERKIASKATVGYYSGKLAELSERKVGELSCTVQIENGEELIARVSIELPSGGNWKNEDFSGEKLNVKLKLTGLQSGKTVEWTPEPTTLTGKGKVELTPIVLDSLAAGKQFSKQFCGPADGLIPGEKFQLEAIAWCESEKLVLYPDSDRDSANSLFANGSLMDGKTAYLACGRHLQNLNTATSGFTGTAVEARQYADISFAEGSAWKVTYNGLTFTPIENSGIAAYYGNGNSIRSLHVSAGGNAGLFATFAGSELNGIELVDPVVVGTGSVGGLAGSVTGDVAVSGCRLYMETLQSGESTARTTHWMDSNGGVAGGLIGSASGSLRIENSFAATVVRGAGCAGGLVGEASGALTVSRSYADCYLHAAAVGGLAGSCGGGSSFTSCYSAGFAMEGGGILTAAGFAPSVADVSDSYTIFCFDDATVAKETNGQYTPTPAPDTMTRYALVIDGATVSNAYYTYDGVQSTHAKLVEAGKLEKTAISGFQTGGQSVEALYHLTDPKLTPSEFYPYPRLEGLKHYNDFLVLDSKPVKLYRFLVTGWGDDPRIKDESVTPGQPFAVTRMSSGRVIVSAQNSRTVQKQVFVGWFDKDHLPQQSELVSWCQQVDGLDIDGYRFSSVPAGLGALQEGYEGDICYVDVDGNERVEEDRVLYAVYREVKSFDIVVQYMSFYADNWLGKDNNGVTAEKYMGTGCFAIRQNSVYTVDPIVFANNGQNYKTATYLFHLRSELEDIDGYTVVDKNYRLDERYKGVELAENIQPVACFDKKLQIIDVSASGENAYDADSALQDLTVRLDRQRTYVVLCDAEMIKVPIKLVFRNSVKTAETIEKFTLEAYDTFEKRIEAVEKELAKVNYSPNAADTYTAEVWMLFPPNVIVWSELPEFEGFKLLRDQIENFTITSASKTKPPVVPYERTPYTLAFNLNGFVYQKDASSEKSSAYDAVPNMYYRQGVKAKLPPVSTLSRPGYKLTGWKFFVLETYGPNAESIGEIKLDESGKKYAEEYYMPHNNVMAELQWEEVLNPPVRVEIYVQNVKDPMGAAEGDRTHNFYNAYTVAPWKKPDQGNNNRYEYYKTITDPATLLTTAYADMKKNRNANVVLDKNAYATEPKNVISTTDVREYLRDAYTGTIDGSVKNHQFKLNAAKTFDENGEIAHEIDATGTAVFRLYYDRETVTFDFHRITGERLVKASGDPNPDDTSASGYGSGFAMIPITLSNDGNCYYYAGQNFWGESVYYPVYVLKDELINNYVKNPAYAFENTNRFRRATVSDTVGAQNYVFGYVEQIKVVTGLFSSETRCYVVPFYNKADLADKDADYQWTRDPDGYFKVEGEPFATHKGLYEADFKDWPKNDAEHAYRWTVRNGKTEKNYRAYLSYLESFYYVSWISGRDGSYDAGEESTRAHKLKFYAQSTDGTNEVCFYLEDPEKSGLDAELRKLVDSGASDETIRQKVDEWLTAKESTIFKTEAEYVYRSNGQSFSLNDKFTGYSVKGYTPDKMIYGDYWYDDGAFYLVTEANSQKTVTFYQKLSIYNLRNWYNVYFENIKEAPREAYFYGTKLDRLPDVEGDPDKYRPDNIGDEYSFQGWYTVDGGNGIHLTVCTRDESGKYVKATGKDGWVTGTLCTCTANANGGFDYEEWEGAMPAANLKLFAYWATGTVRVDFYSRLPVAVGDTPEPETPYTYASAHLFKTIDASVFQTVESGWGLVEKPDPRTSGKTARVYTVGEEEYAFDGWYRYTGSGAPGHDEVLISRFHEKEFVTTPDRLKLAAQWTQIAGEAYYDIVCYLLDDEGNIQRDENGDYVFVRIEGSEQNRQKARVGEPLNAQAPSTSDYPELAAYYPTSPLVSVEKFEKGKDVVFFYRPAESWTYRVQHTVTYRELGGSATQEVLMSDEERSTAALNVIVYPEDVAGYIRSTDAKQKQILKTDPEQERIARFAYTLDMSCIWQPRTADWVLSEEKPLLLNIATADGELACVSDGFEIRQYYSVDNTEKSTELPALTRGAHSVVITLELWRTDGTPSRVLTIYRGTTSVRVYSAVHAQDFETLYYDGAGFYTRDSATGVMAAADLVELARARAAELGKTFLGFWLGETQVIDKDGRVIADIAGDDVTLTAKFE